MRTLIAAAFVFLFAGGIPAGAAAEEVAAEVKSSDVLPPVAHADVAAEEGSFAVLPAPAQADKRDIFRAYESALLRPAERCREWELTDPRVRRVVSDAAEHFGSIAKMISCYRSPDYNKRLYTTKVKVKKRGKVRVVSRVLRPAYTSFHVKRMAIDFTVEGVARDILAAFVRAHPLMQERGGIGRYTNSDIIHIDSGPRRDWLKVWRQPSWTPL
jgi:uncharacterized protein YcbK (DUF882 family)